SADAGSRLTRIIVVGNFTGTRSFARMRSNEGQHPDFGVAPGRAFLQKPHHRDGGIAALFRTEAVPGAVSAIDTEPAETLPTPIVSNIGEGNVGAEDARGDRQVPRPGSARLWKGEAIGHRCPLGAPACVTVRVPSVLKYFRKSRDVLADRITVLGFA